MQQHLTLFFCPAARNDALLHSVALHIMPQHGALYYGIVCCATAWCIAMLPQGLGGTINLCGIGCHDVLALLVVVFFVEAVALLLLFFGGGQSTCLALALLASVAWRSWVFVFFCRSIALSSAAFCGAIFVPQHCFMCHGIALCAAAQFFVPRGCFCAAALFL